MQMLRIPFHLVAILLLVVQVTATAASARIICLHLQDDEVAHRTHVPCDHEAMENRSSAGIAVGGHEHRLLDMAAHPAHACTCHVHVPSPGNDLSTNSSFQKRDSQVDLGLLMPPMLVVAYLDWNSTLPDVYASDTRDFAFPQSAQVLSIKSTRLLI